MVGFSVLKRYRIEKLTVTNNSRTPIRKLHILILFICHQIQEIKEFWLTLVDMHASLHFLATNFNTHARLSTNPDAICQKYDNVT